ncbi:MAG: hypothetical protein QOF82_2672 [Frankiales bacterium]|jgi:hypothetical protein|nr:hypothetical protein [Frankiales bacterium]MDX6213585.1 hypothetical protein [Frankiales bacterium]
MIWTTWRQHRAEAIVGAVIVAAIGAAMVVVGTIARTRSRTLGVPACLRSRADCTDALGQFHNFFHTIPPFTGALIALPLLAGMFWAAPLVSREYEAGTHRLAWTQSVGPLRWITVKLGLIFGLVAVAALTLGLLATWALDPLTAAFGGRYNSTWYDVQGIVPLACMLFALSVGVATSALIRRTVPAMAVTLLVYAAARIPVHWIRPHFAPLTTRTLAVPLSTLLQSPGGNPQDAFASSVPLGAWVQHVAVTDPSGGLVSRTRVSMDLLTRYCPDLQPINATSTNTPPRISAADAAACRPHLQGLSLHETISYQPASHFWLLQTVESAVFLVLAALLVTAAVLAVTHRRPT